MFIEGVFSGDISKVEVEDVAMLFESKHSQKLVFEKTVIHYTFKSGMERDGTKWDGKGNTKRKK